MAQPSQIIEYLGSISIKKGTAYTSTQVLTKYPDATMLEMKSTKNGTGIDSYIKVSINGCDMFPVPFGDQTHLPNTLTTYIFDEDCIVAIGRYVQIT